MGVIQGFINDAFIINIPRIWKDLLSLSKSLLKTSI